MKLVKEENKKKIPGVSDSRWLIINVEFHMVLDRLENQIIAKIWISFRYSYFFLSTPNKQQQKIPQKLVKMKKSIKLLLHTQKKSSLLAVQV